MPSSKIYIYAIYFPTNDKYYIGITNDLHCRMLRHLRSKHLVGKALRKYEDWQVSILHIRTDREEAKLLEIENIRNFNCINPNGYNQTRGGDGGNFLNRKHSEESKRKMGMGDRSAVIKRNKEDNPMSDPNTLLRWKISRLKTSISKLERDN